MHFARFDYHWDKMQRHRPDNVPSQTSQTRDVWFSWNQIPILSALIGTPLRACLPISLQTPFLTIIGVDVSAFEEFNH